MSSWVRGRVGGPARAPRAGWAAGLVRPARHLASRPSLIVAIGLLVVVLASLAIEASGGVPFPPAIVPDTAVGR